MRPQLIQNKITSIKSLTKRLIIIFSGKYNINKVKKKFKSDQKVEMFLNVFDV